MTGWEKIITTLKTLFLKQDLIVHLKLTSNWRPFSFHFLSAGTTVRIILLNLFIYVFKKYVISPTAQVIQCQELCLTYLYVPKYVTSVHKERCVSDELD